MTVTSALVEASGKPNYIAFGFFMVLVLACGFLVFLIRWRGSRK